VLQPLCIVPRTFLRRTDPCFEQLRSRDQATEDLMKIVKLVPGALDAISNMASSSSSPGPANPTPNLPPSGGGVGRCWWRWQVARARAKAKAPTSGMQADHLRLAVRLRRPPVTSHCLLPGRLRQTVHGVLRSSRSSVRQKTRRRDNLSSFLQPSLMSADSLALTASPLPTTVGSLFAPTGFQLLTVSTRSFTI